MSSFTRVYASRAGKGVSPLIAAVLLIAFTLAIGGFMSSWLQNMARTQTETASKNADAGCSYLNINPTNATFNASGDNRLVLTIENSGTRNAIIDKIRVTGQNLNTTTYSNPANFSGTLNSGDEITIAVTVNTSYIDSVSGVRIIPADCPQSAATLSGSEVTSYT